MNKLTITIIITASLTAMFFFGVNNAINSDISFICGLGFVFNFFMFAGCYLYYLIER